MLEEKAGPRYDGCWIYCSSKWLKWGVWGGAQHADHLPCALQRLGLGVREGVRGACPPPPHSHTQTHFNPFLFLCLSSQTRPEKTSVPLPLLPSLSPFLLSFLLFPFSSFISGSLSISAVSLPFSPLTSTPVFYSPSNGTSLHSPSLSHQWAHLCTPILL